MMPLTLNILINRSFKSQFLIFYWMMMSDQFCSWTMVLLILLIVGMMWTWSSTTWSTIIRSVHGIRVLDDLVLARDVKLECAVEVRLMVCFLWAHFAIHIHDELPLATQVSQPHFGQVWGWSPTLGKVRGLESSGTPECSELDSKAQNALHWGVLGVIGKLLKRRYRKWLRIDNSDSCNPSYGQKKGRESNGSQIGSLTPDH